MTKNLIAKMALSLLLSLSSSSVFADDIDVVKQEFVQLTQQIVQLHLVFDVMLQSDSNWPIRGTNGKDQKEIESVSSEQLICVRSMFSRANTNKYIKAKAKNYAEHRGDALADDLKLLKSGLADSVIKFYEGLAKNQPVVDNSIVFALLDPNFESLIVKVLLIDLNKGGLNEFNRAITFLLLQSFKECGIKNLLN